MHLHILVAIVIGALPVTLAHAQLSIPLTLAEAEDRALAAEPGQLALQAQATALGERAVVAAQLPDPQFRVGLNNFPVDGGGFRQEGMTHALVGIQQRFPPGETRALSARQFEALASKTQSQGEAHGRDVLAAVRQVWLDLYYQQRAYELVNESRPFFEDLASVTRSLYSVGRKSQQDVLRAELELSRLDDRLIDIERRQSLARAALGEWLGRDASRPIAGRLPSWDQVPTLESMQAALDGHPTLQAAAADTAARSAGVALADERSKPGWALSLGYSYREGTLPIGEPRSDFISVGVTVDLPFFRSKSVDSTLSAALSEQSAARSSEVALQRKMRSRLAAEYAHWRDLTRRLSVYEQRILPQARDSAEAALLAYQSDRADFADVMRGYIDNLNTRIKHVRIQVDRAQSYAVLANLGGLPR
jgi:outer membrane protein TolC